MKKVLVPLILLFSCILFSQNILLEVSDAPNDDGSALILKWDALEVPVAKLILERKSDQGNYQIIKQTNNSQGHFEDSKDIEPNLEFVYKISGYNEQNELISSSGSSAVAKAQWFNTNKISLLIMTLILTISIIYFIYSAKRGKELYIRKIGGLESLDESVGRATEMGRPILFIPGTLDLNDMQTIAGLTMLGKLAQKAAEYDAKLIVPVCRSMVLSTAKEIVKESYMKAGRPDAFDPDSVFYLTDDQFGFVAGVDGIIVRDKPAANFFLGAFYAESLILAETGFTSGAIQTAGTAMPSQLPFFVVACDYTLIGEELFAASAYLSKDPHQLGSLKGQDLGKAIFVILLIIGVILEISNIHFLKDFLTIH